MNLSKNTFSPPIIQGVFLPNQSFFTILEPQTARMKLLLLLLSFLPVITFSQTLSGKVIDKVSQQPVGFAMVKILPLKGGMCQENGSFEFENITLPATLVVSADEYITDTITVSQAQIVIELFPEIKNENELGTVVIAANRRKQSVEEVTVSMDVIKASLVTNKGITSLDEAVDQAPGAYTMDGQVSIRGGSGFSYGAGSRVMVLWNEVPLLSGDAGDAKWNAIPIEQAEQIEVIKGASSVLYGSGALNGIVSLIEREPTSKPVFTAKVQNGIYGDPKRETLKWWDKSPMYQQADVTYSKQFNRFGMNLGAYAFSNDGYREGETEDRFRFNGTLYWRPAKLPKLKATLGWNAQTQTTGNFIIWQSDTFAYQPVGGADTSNAASSLTYNKGWRVTVDPSLKYIDKFNNKHHLKTRLYWIDNNNVSNPSQSSTSQLMYGDYQFQRNWKNIHLVLTTGTSATQTVVKSYLYGDHRSTNAAVYAQLEKKWGKFDLSGGFRAEYFEQDGLRGDSDFYVGKDSTKLPVRPIFRTGMHYQVAKYTHLRASFGQGVRYPSVAERYTNTNVGSLNVFANPNLKPETGWAAELGIKQGIKISNWKGYLDVSGFINHYNDMMEFTFGFYKPDSIPFSGNPNAPGYFMKWLGFKAQNAEEARITGAEISLAGTGKIGPVEIQTLLGYTYMNPISLNSDSAYRATFSDTSTNMLKYRFNHLAKADLQLEYKGFSLGGSLRMNSFMKNIDLVFEDGVLNGNANGQILLGLKEYRETHQNWSIVMDTRVGYTYKEKYKLAFIINNVLNAEYMTRPGDIQAPRTFVVQLGVKF